MTGAHEEPEGLQTTFTVVDFVLFGLTVFPSLVTLMFVTSGGVRFLENVRGRRMLMLAFLVAEAASIVALVLHVTS